jgi:hypothetical protein
MDIDEIVQNLKNKNLKELYNAKRRLYYLNNKEKMQEYGRIKAKEFYENNKDAKKKYYENKKDDPEFIEKRKKKYQETKKLISLAKNML